MLEIDRSKMEDIFYRIVGVPSVSGTTKEIDVVKEIEDIFMEMPYFKENPDNVRTFDLKNDGLNRKLITALVEGNGSSNETVILMGHVDVVDITDYGKNKKYAYNPKELIKHINPNNLSKSAKEDFDTGDWIFGRGVMDMKCGIAGEIALLESASRNRDQLNGNLLFVGVPDEENNSLGMVSGIEPLLELAEEKGLDYVVAIDGEPQFPRFPGDNNKYIYTGTIGKFMMMTYIVGKETHGGDSLTGLNPNFIASELNRRLEANVDLCDEYDGFYVQPPTCLKQTDTKDLYSVKTPDTAYAYYNFLTIDKTPKYFFEKVEELAHEAITEAIENHKVQSEKFSKASGSEAPNYGWTPKVYSFKEIYDMAIENGGEDFKNHIKKCTEEWKNDNTIDERQLSVRILEEVYNYCPDKDPKIILFYTAPYYPHVKPTSETKEAKKVLKTAEKVVEYAKNSFNEDVYIEKFFTGLCDLSYFCLQDAEDVIENLKPNMPNWGIRYELPLEAIKKINLPVLNVGPYGKDAHKNTERLHYPYSFNVFPKLLALAVDEMLK